jgi:hypothetical protein
VIIRKIRVRNTRRVAALKVATEERTRIIVMPLLGFMIMGRTSDTMDSYVAVKPLYTRNWYGPTPVIKLYADKQERLYKHTGRT